MTTETREITVYEGEFAVLGPEAQEYLDILEENTGSRVIEAGSLPVWKFPSAGGDEWLFEDTAGMRHKAAVLTGVILGQREERTFFRSKFSGGGEHPDCQSSDGVTGYPATDESGTPQNLIFTRDGQEIEFGGACATCPLAQWESAEMIGKDGRGKACTERRFLIIQRPDQPTPEGVRLPPTALKSWQAFGAQLAHARMRLSRTVLDLRLTIPKGESKTQLDVSPVGVLTAELSDQLKALAPDMKRPQLAAPVEAAQGPDPDFPPFD
jgi:hypothetical protein